MQLFLYVETNMHAKYDYVSLLVQNSMMKSQKSLKNEISEMSKPIVIHLLSDV